MKWISPSVKDSDSTTLEKKLWDAADQFRANSGLKPQEYSGPILGLIFLRFAEVRFLKQRAKLEKTAASSRRGNRMEEPEAYHADGILFLPTEAQFDYLLNRPEAENIGAKVNAAMREIEKQNPTLAGVLPKTYNLFPSTLLKDLLKKVSEIAVTTDYDAFGRIYEYFLGEFARTEGQKGGEFYTPSGIVRLLTEVIEPFHGLILDPACGSGGMFVQSAKFVSEHRKSPRTTPSPPAPLPEVEGRTDGAYSGDPSRVLHSHPSPTGRRDGDEGLAADYSGDPSRELSIHGVEKTDETGRLCRMNLAVHGLEGDIRHGGNINSYYDDPFDACGANIEPSSGASRHPLPLGEGRGEGHGIERHGRFDFVLANPPFNVNAVDKERIKDAVGKGRRFPLGLPRTDNANYIWIQLFYSSLNSQGRAGFVMANSASDARSSEQDIRQKLIEDHAVDVMVAVGPNMFYTVTLPCTLWFMDKAKSSLPPCPPSTRPDGHPSPTGRRDGDEGEQRGARYCDTVLFIDARNIYRQIDRAHRDWTPAQISFIANIVRLYRGEALDYTLGGEEARAKIEEVFADQAGALSDGLLFAAEPAAKYTAVSSHHPSTSGRGAGGEGAGNIVYRDVPGLCRAATIEEIAQQGWSLNPGRYVGVAAGEVVSDENFKEQLETLNEELETLNAKARELEETIANNVAEILEA